jgi:RNA polymerase sigma factor (sigma-70 family)
MDKHKLIVDHLYLTRVLALEHNPKASSLELDELISHASLGLIEAAQGYKPELGFKFKTYAYYRIRGRIKGQFRSQRRAFKKLHPITIYDNTLIDSALSRESLQPESMALYNISRKTVRNAIARLPSRERKIIVLCDLWGRKQDFVAKLFSVEASRISQLRSSALKHLRTMLRDVV